MSDVPKIVHDRLRAAQPRGTHPDADVLSAFAEQSLSGLEREGVLAHLAACRDCREVVALSLPALEDSAQPMAQGAVAATAGATQAPRSWFAWPNLRWVAVAAGVVVVASVLILRPGKAPHDSIVSSVNREAEAPASAVNQVQAETGAASPSLAQSSRPLSTDQAARTLAKTGEKKADQLVPGEARGLRSQESRSFASLKKQAPEPGGGVGGLAGNDVLADSKRMDSNASDKLAPKVPSPDGGPVAGAPAAPPAGVASETVEVSGEDLAPAQAPAKRQLLAENRVEPVIIQKAKAPSKDEASKQSMARAKTEALGASSNYAFIINGPIAASWKLSEGSLQRSIDSGSTWQTVLRADHPLLCNAVLGNDIWAGGQAGTVYHSGDGGATWTLLHPVAKTVNGGKQLNADITRIELDRSGAVSVITNHSESWTSVDQGKTWTMRPVDTH